MVLYINCCPRENSRTERLAKALLNKIGEFREIKLYEENIHPIDREQLKKRTRLIGNGDYSDRMFDLAKQFAAAECIVIAAPYWDLSFPSQLKVYFENIYVTGIVSEYGENGAPNGLCKAEKLYYVTTAGGPYDRRFSYDYIREMSLKYFGIRETELIKAEMLDIVGNDPEAILADAISRI